MFYGSQSPKINLEQKATASSTRSKQSHLPAPCPGPPCHSEYCPVSVGKQFSKSCIHLFKSYLSLFHAIQYQFFLFIHVSCLFPEVLKLVAVTFIEIESTLNTEYSKYNLRKIYTKVVDNHKNVRN